MDTHSPTPAAPAVAMPSGVNASRVKAPPFAGFKGTLDFLSELSRNNDKTWFEAHRAVYEETFVTPGAAFVAALGPKLRTLSPTINFVPRINGSVFRIHRDVRFSKDKRPYKDHMALWFWEGPIKSMSVPGFYFHLAPQTLILGVGLYRFDRNQLQSYRDAVVDTGAGSALERALAAVVREAYGVGAPARKRVPRGYDAEHPRAGLLLHDGLTATWEGAPPESVGSPDFVDGCLDHYRALMPIQQWLTEHVTAASRAKKDQL